jgi:hypothetical protein
MIAHPFLQHKTRRQVRSNHSLIHQIDFYHHRQTHRLITFALVSLPCAAARRQLRLPCSAVLRRCAACCGCVLLQPPACVLQSYLDPARACAPPPDLHRSGATAQLPARELCLRAGLGTASQVYVRCSTCGGVKEPYYSF